MRIVHPLMQYGAILLDADGTLRRCLVPGQPCPNAPGEYELLPNVQATLARYNWDEIGVSIVSNQGGVGLGFLTETMARFLLHDTLLEALRYPVGPERVFLCPHRPRDGCACRKPKPGLLLQAEMYWYSRAVLHGPGQCVYVGDQITDWQAAVAAGIPFIHAKDFFWWDAEEG